VVGRVRLGVVVSVGIVLVTAGTLVGCSTGSGLPRVAVIGDSITALAQPDISAALDPSFDVHYTFRIGVRTDQMLGLIASDLQANGPMSAAVINLGTNDAIKGGPSAPALANFDALLTMSRSVPCEVLTTISLRADIRGGSDVAAALNRKILDLAIADPGHYKVVDWNGFLSSLDRAQLGQYLQRDLIHQTPAGAQWIATSYRAALHVCGTGQPAPTIGTSTP